MTEKVGMFIFFSDILSGLCVLFVFCPTTGRNGKFKNIFCHLFSAFLLL